MYAILKNVFHSLESQMGIVISCVCFPCIPKVRPNWEWRDRDTSSEPQQTLFPITAPPSPVLPALLGQLTFPEAQLQLSSSNVCTGVFSYYSSVFHSITPLPKMPVHSSKRTGNLGFLSLSTLLWVLPTLPDKRQRTARLPLPLPQLCTDPGLPILISLPNSFNTQPLDHTLNFDSHSDLYFQIRFWNISSFLQDLKGLLKDRDHISSFAKISWIAKCDILCKSSLLPQV